MKLNRQTYRDAIDRIQVPDGLETRIHTKLATPQQRRLPIRALATALTVVLLAAALGITAAAIEAKAYRDAVNFFASNSLSTEDLSRDEIKAVHRDITSGNFSLAATNSLILREYDTPIEGQAITPQLLEELWNNRNATAENILPFKPEKSDYTIDYTEWEGVYTDVTVSHRIAGWSVTLEDFIIYDTLETDHGLLLYGYTPDASTTSYKFARTALINHDGSLAWDKHFGHSGRGFERDYLNAAIAEEERIVLFGRGDFTTLTVTFLDYAGNQLGYATTPLGGPYGIRDVTRLGEEYLVRVTNESLSDRERILRLDADGIYLDRLSYTLDTDATATAMRITDTLEYGGQLYLSGYLYPDNGKTGTRGEIDHIFEEIFSRDTALPWGEVDGLVDDLRQTYTAVLLRCDPSTGEPAEFYSVEGAMGDALAVDESGNLTWDTAHFATAIFSPATSAFTVAADCDVLRYTFDEHGNLIRETATGRTIGYTR